MHKCAVTMINTTRKKYPNLVSHWLVVNFDFPLIGKQLDPDTDSDPGGKLYADPDPNHPGKL